MGKTKTGKTGLFWRIFITAVGIALIFLALVRPALFFFGEGTYANVSVRRVGGADSGKPPEQRYVWSLDYSFTDKNGIIHNGTTTRRGSDMAVVTDDRVYYFPSAPFLNALEGDAEPNLSQFLYLAAGVFLVYFMNRKGVANNKN